MGSHAYHVPFASHLSSMGFVSHAPPFTIFPRDASGRPGPQYPPGHPPHLVSAINLCRAKMDHYMGRRAFKTIAVRFTTGRPNSWFLRGSRPLTMDQVTNAFIDGILETFVIVFVDYALNNPDNKGFHSRREWHGNFDPAQQAISVNGRMIDHMSTAFQRADNEHWQHIFRAFLFKTSNILLHEMAHVFITYLSKGLILTPPRINALAEGIPGSDGEAGRALECLLFGGTINFFYNSVNPDSPCGTAYIKKPSGAYYRILRITIDDTVTFRLYFPYEHEHQAERGYMGRLGEGYGPDYHTDPLDRREVAYLLR